MAKATNRSELVEQLAEIGLVGAVKEGSFDGALSDPSEVSANLHIVHKGSMATYTPAASDNGAYMVFDYAGDMVITLPSALTAPESNPFTMFVVNTLGRIDFALETPFVGYAPHAAQNVTVGLLRGSTNWYATGTNNKEELG